MNYYKLRYFYKGTEFTSHNIPTDEMTIEVMTKNCKLQMKEMKLPSMMIEEYTELADGDQLVKETEILFKEAAPMAPMVNRYPDWTEVIEQAKSRCKYVQSPLGLFDYEEDAQYMFEAVMKAMYGSKYFDWENKL